MTNIVPTFLPSRPSRAISTARRMTVSSVLLLIPRASVKMSCKRWLGAEGMPLP
jgi:hypothetical protein